MIPGMPICPQPPTWNVDWDHYDRAYGWVRRLKDCPQDPIWHAEGNVWIHTRMVCESLASLSAWRNLPAVDRQILFTSALLHDVAKPDCTKTELDGRITSRGHSRRGSLFARRYLWENEVPFALREQVAGLIRWHQVPYQIWKNANPGRLAIEVSQSARCDHLTILAEADVRGRICADQAQLLDNIALFGELSRENECLARPRAFPTEHGRFLYFRDEGRYVDDRPYEDFRSEVILMSGLPGAGKDYWVKQNLADWPAISLDALREELDIDPGKDQGTVVNAARDQARTYLREGQAFVWNATNLSRQLRQQSITLFANYKARVRIVYLDVPHSVLFQQNHHRAGAVPPAAIERMLDRWEVPDITEAHRVDYVVRDAP